MPFRISIADFEAMARALREVPKPHVPMAPLASIPGCDLLPSVEAGDVNPEVQEFCSGLKKHPARDTAGTVLAPDRVISYMDTCRSEATFSPSKRKDKVFATIAHKESTVMETPTWQERQRAIGNILRDRFALECNRTDKPKTLLCRGAMDKSKVKLLGTFLTSTGNIDWIRDPSCSEPLVFWAYQQAVRQQGNKDLTKTRMHPHDMFEWEDLCQKLKAIPQAMPQ